MISPKFSTDNANYYLVYAHHSNISYDDFPIVGPLLGRIFGKKRLDKTNSEAYPTFEDIFRKDRIKNLDGIVLENYRSVHGEYRLNSTDQYKKIIKSVVETKSKIPIYFVDVDADTDHKKVYKYVAGFGLMFFVTAAAMGTYGTVRRHRAKKLEKLEKLIAEETERYKEEQERLRIEYEVLQENGHDAEAIRKVKDEIQVSTFIHQGHLSNIIRYNEKKFKKLQGRRRYSRRDFLKVLGVSTAYLGISAYFCGGHLVWPYMLAYKRGESGEVAPYVTYLQTELFPTTTINLRNAIWARKIEEVIAPRLKKKLKRKPTIALVVGTNHAGLKWYIKDKSKRDRQIKRYEYEILKMYHNDSKDLNGVREIIFGGIRKFEGEDIINWDSEFLENKGLIL